MAIACTDYKAWGVTHRISGTGTDIKKRTVQYLELTVTAAAADVDMDLGDVSGNAWGQIDNNALGLAARTALVSILAKVDRFLGWSCPQIDHAYLPIYGKAVAVTLSVGVVNNTAKNMPEFVFFANEAPTTAKYIFQWTLTDGQAAVNAGW